MRALKGCRGGDKMKWECRFSFLKLGPSDIPDPWTSRFWKNVCQCAVCLGAQRTRRTQAWASEAPSLIITTQSNLILSFFRNWLQFLPRRKNTCVHAQLNPTLCDPTDYSRPGSSFSPGELCTIWATREARCGTSGKETACQCRRPGFNPCVGKLSWKRAWQPSPGFLPGESRGERSLVGYSPWGRKESDMAEAAYHALYSCSS